MTKTTFGSIIRNLLRHSITKKNETMTGRWNLDYDHARQNRKVYWANMDHCGCCCHDNIKTVQALNKKTEKYNTRRYKREDSEEYILPYVM